MNPEHNKERRLARAKALVDLHVREEGAVYADAAEYQGSSGAYAAGVVGCNEDRSERPDSRSAPGRGGGHRLGRLRPRMHYGAV
ncbi:hypothetical protein MTO96_042565 [Rhipicephalus appendiculatus]